MSPIRSFKWHSSPAKFALHASIWVSIMFFPFLFIHHPIASDLFPTFALGTCLMAALYYTNANVLIPKLLAQGKIKQYIALVIISAVVIFILLNLIDQFLLPQHIGKPPFNKPHGKMHILGHFFPVLFVLAISTSITITGEWFRNEKQKKEMENEKLMAELAFLKAQVNPHFLFNTLNNIYTLAYKKSDATAESIMKLSQLMRYMIYDSNVTFISLDKELEYIQNYIDLQRMRLSDEVDVVFDIEGDINGKAIAPMLLVPFIENAFKHGVSYVDNQPIEIKLKIQNNNWLYFEVENHVFNIGMNKDEKNSGIGLLNTKRRLELIYPESYDLNIVEDKTTYKVTLLIKIA